MFLNGQGRSGLGLWVAGGDTWSVRAAPANPAASTTATKMLIHCSRSTFFLGA
jgi:hypothetical protein